MLSMSHKWQAMPPSVRKAIIALVAGWAAHYVFYFGFIAEDQPERVIYLNLGVGIGICYCVATIRKWARRLSLFFNFIMVMMYSLFAIAFFMGDKPGLFSLSVFTAVAFGLSFWYLMQKEASVFFSPPEKSEGESTDDPPLGPHKKISK